MPCRGASASSLLCAKPAATSSIFYRHPDRHTTPVPNHAGRDLARPLLREILREIDMTPEQFQAELKRM
jgi:HicA-like toxin of HicAB toxin-antitoxin system